MKYLKRFARWPALLTLACSFCLANARQHCDGRCQLGDVDDFSKYMVRVADYVGMPPRVTVASLGPEAESRYAATGKIFCRGFDGKLAIVGSAQLTYKHDLITTVGHTFINTDYGKCMPRGRPEDCKFVLRKIGVDRTIGIKKLEGTGLSCPSKNSPEDDWAVMRLAQPLEDIDPYPIDPNQSLSLAFGTKVVTVAHSLDFKSSSPNDSGPKHYGACSVLAVYGGPPVQGVSTACGCSDGCSGGSLLSADPYPVLLGIWTETGETPDQARAAQARGKPNLVQWQKDGNGSYYRVLSGDFLSTLINAGQSSPN